MEEVLSIEDIYSKFESEWILLEEPETDKYLNIKRGKVLWHSKDRDEIDDIAMELHPKHIAVFYTGELVPEGTAIIL